VLRPTLPMAHAVGYSLSATGLNRGSESESHGMIFRMVEESAAQYVKRVREYFDSTNELYLKHLGSTYQAGLVVVENSETDIYRAHNLYCASQAGIKPHDRVLDAGCGSCGPAVDIATEIDSIQIEAITLSPVQARSAKTRIANAGLTGRVRVHIADFHSMPFSDGFFDIVYFLECIGYSYDPSRLFQEVHRVLRPGGMLYIKDVFVKQRPLDEQEQRALDEFNRAYVYKTQTLASTLNAISAAGFQQITSRDLSDRITTKEFARAKWEYASLFPVLSEFGRVHQYSHDVKPLPTYFAEIKAAKEVCGRDARAPYSK
jgi:ubiquinone/menaquinone biosynthesis C-methylase UbiE